MTDHSVPRGVSSTAGRAFLGLTISGLVLAMLYGAAYGVARWRKSIVMYDYYAKEEGLIVRRTGPGLDVRADWRGRAKNCVNPVVFTIFRPLCALEDLARGGSRPIH
jgi:hypothetical protein